MTHPTPRDVNISLSHRILKQLDNVTVSSIAFLRGLFPEVAFGDRSLEVRDAMSHFFAELLFLFLRDG